MIYMEQDNTATSTTDTTTATTTDTITTGTDSTTQTTEQDTATVESFKAFATEADYNNAIKSERSKAKNEILLELGVSNVNDGKEALTKASTIETELNTYKEKSTQLEEQLALTKLGVKESYSEEALALAKAKVSDTVDLTAALTEVAVKFPVMLGKQLATPAAIGGETSEDTASAEEGKLSTHMMAKYPWLNLK